MDHFDQLLAHAEGIRAVNTHAHHLPDSLFDGYDLKRLLKGAYVSWYGQPIGASDDSREAYLSQVKNTSYFIWLERSLKSLYAIDEPLCASSWLRFDAAIKAAHAHSGARLALMERLYHRVILDAYWKPGDDNAHPALFAPTFRVNMFFFGYNRAAKDHNGNNAQTYYGVDIHDLDEYTAFVKEKIGEMKRRGAIALKSALAYDRPLDFGAPERDKAARVFRKDGYMPNEADIRAFQDHLFDVIAKTAAELNLPFQNHTGLGKLKGTSALNLLGAIERNPDTRFVLFHGGYPWTDDILGLTHNFRNVFPDLCWLPIISTTRAARFVNELLDVALFDRTTWGCDTWSPEESLGALMAARHALARALSDRVRDGFMDLGEARRVMEGILAGNAKKLYGL